MSAREDVLQRIRSALGPDPVTPPVPRAYRTGGDLDRAELLTLLENRLVDYKARVHRCAPGEEAATVAAVLEQVPPGRVVTPPGLPPAWTAGREVLAGESATTEELDQVVAVVTACAVAVAETGTFVLDGGPDQGRRAISLVPDLHVCVVRADQVVQTVPEAVARLDPRRPLTWVSGPSATSDIELSRVEGVHGPRTLEVVLVEG